MRHRSHFFSAATGGRGCFWGGAKRWDISLQKDGFVGRNGVGLVLSGRCERPQRFPSVLLPWHPDRGFHMKAASQTPVAGFSVFLLHWIVTGASTCARVDSNRTHMQSTQMSPGAWTTWMSLIKPRGWCQVLVLIRVFWLAAIGEDRSPRHELKTFDMNSLLRSFR